MIDFWNSVDQLPLDDLPTRLLLMLRNMYSSNNEELFLATSNFLLLEAASVAPGFKTSLFDTDLTADANTFKVKYKA